MSPRTPEGACAICGRGGYPRYGTECAEWCGAMTEAYRLDLAPGCGDAVGTYAGSMRHRRRGESPCGPCLAARRVYQAAVKRRHDAAKALAAAPRGEHGTAGGARGVGAAGVSAVREGRT